MLARRELLLTHPMVHSELHEDYICWLQILRSIDGARGLSEGLILYRMTDKSKSRDKKKSARMTWDTYAYLGIPFAQHFIRLMQGIFPVRLFDFVFGDICGLYTVMNHFTGRKPVKLPENVKKAS